MNPADQRARRAIEAINVGEIVLIMERDQKQEINRCFLALAAERATPERILRLEQLAGSKGLFFAMPASQPAEFANIDPKITENIIHTCSRGMLERASATEAGVDMTRMAGLRPGAVLAEVSAETARSMSDVVQIYSEELVAHRFRHEPLLHRAGDASIPTSLAGEFQTIVYESSIDRAEHVALVKGKLSGSEPVLVRLHSKCFTGDVLGSERCDCGPQLHQAMQRLEAEGRGVLLYLDQEGRGIGLANKMKAYGLQDRGWDTVSANEELGFAADIRDYGIAAQMLYDLGVRRVRLMTNNPLKVLGLTALGIEVTERVPCEVLPNAHNKKYLETKKAKLGHLLS